MIARIGVALGAAAFVCGLSGCDTNSWFDPSVVGRWENTPKIAPILERLDVVEPLEKDYVEATSVTPGDLIPDVQAYSIGPSDTLLIEVFELFDPGVPYIFQRVVDDTGYISVPLVGSVYIAGLTEADTQRVIGERLSPDILRDPQVSVVAQNKTQNRFAISGPAGAGLLDIPHPRFRLTDALAAYGSTPQSTDYIYVIRQIPLDDAVVRGTAGPGVPPDAAEPDAGGEMMEDTGADDMSLEDEGAALDDMIDDLVGGDEVMQPGDAGGGQADGETPALQIPTPSADDDPTRTTKWVFLDGKWVRVKTDPATELNGDADTPDLVTDLKAEELVTQRVIKVPVKPLLEGVAAYNIIVRPDDIIRIPAPEMGLIYVSGEIARPGPYNLPQTGRMTLIRAIAGAGGLAPLAIPSRVDITRMIGDDRQATVRVNLRAIVEMTEPDIYLKPDDVINVGTTWWASPLAVARNGFRMTYGFGFLLDRNFGNDVFGAPPTDNNNN